MNTFLNETKSLAPPVIKAKTRQILIAEDNEDLLDLLEYLVKSIGFEGRIAVNGEEAYEILSAARPDTFDIILSDIEMPKLNGFDFLIKLRKNNFRQPFIFMTAAPTNDYVQRAQELGIQDILEKPFEIETLKEHLDKFFI